MFALVVRFRCGNQQNAAGFDALVARTVPLIQAHEPGTLVYAVHEVQGEPFDRVFYELYRDRAAFNAHENQDYVRAFLAEREQYLASFEVSFLIPTSVSFGAARAAGAGQDRLTARE